MTTQRDHKRSITVDSGLGDVTSVSRWRCAGLFENEEQVKGAFILAYQQGLDGMGKSIAHWMGLTEREFRDYIKSNRLPK